MDETKVLLILADGMRPDSLALCGSPHPAALLKQSAHTLACTTVVPPVTLPCHMSLFHSVPPARHGVTTNLYTPPVRPVAGLCERLHAAGKSCAFFYDWEELRDLARPGSLSRGLFVSGGRERYAAADPVLAREAARLMREEAPDFVFLYLGLTDHAGHECGWMSALYLEAVRDSWERIAEVLRDLPPAYSVIVTADHGGHDRTHGVDCPEDMHTPLLLRGPRFTPGSTLPRASILDLAPTVAALLGVPADPEWEGRSLL